MKLIKQGSRLVIVCTIKSWTMSSSGWWLGWLVGTPWAESLNIVHKPLGTMTWLYLTSFSVPHTIMKTALSWIKEHVWAGLKLSILSWMFILRPLSLLQALDEALSKYGFQNLFSMSKIIYIFSEIKWVVLVGTQWAESLNIAHNSLGWQRQSYVVKSPP